jgi:hypothetical protein
MRRNYAWGQHLILTNAFYAYKMRMMKTGTKNAEPRINLYMDRSDVQKLERIARSQRRSKSKQVAHWVNEEWKKLFGGGDVRSFNSPDSPLSRMAA